MSESIGTLKLQGRTCAYVVTRHCSAQTQNLTAALDGHPSMIQLTAL
jgi:hypothetical protein